MIISLLIFLFLFVSPAHGQHFSSLNYQIDWGNFNMTSGQKNSTNYSLTDTAGQLAPGLFSNTGFKVKSGFQYIYDIFYPFSFSLNTLSLDLGHLVADTGSTASHTFSISSPAGHGYQIMINSNHPLSTNTGTTIPDTVCDASNCTYQNSALWTLSTAYGFGYNTQGVGATDYFSTANHYRPLPHLSSNQSSVIIMSENAPIRSRQGQVNYKALISSIQPAGYYQNSVIFTAVPKY